MVGGSSNHFTANFWRFHEVDFKERSLLGADRRHELRRLADRLRRTRALLHEGRVGGWRLGARRREPVRPAALEALPDAAAAGEILRRAARARRAQARPAPVPGADGHRLRAVPRPARLRALRLLHRLRLRDAGEVLDAVHDDPRGRGDRPLRGAQRELRVPHRRRTTATASPASPTSTRPAGALPEGACRGACAPTAPRRRACCSCRPNARHPDGLANSSGLVGRNLMFNTYAEAHAIFEHELNEYKSVQVTRIVHDFYDSGPEARLLRRRRIRRAHRPQSDRLGAVRAARRTRAWGAEFKALIEAMPRAMVVATHGTSLPLESNRVDLDPGAQGRVGPARDARHLQGPPRRPGVRAVPAGSRLRR